MKPVRTRCCNARLVAPKTWQKEHGSCAELPVGRHNGRIYSYWKPSLREIFLMILGRPVRHTMHGWNVPPMEVDIGNREESARA